MEVRDFLELQSSRLHADMIADKIEEDPDVFDQVWKIMLEEKHPVSMRAAWSLTIFAKKHPYYIEPLASRVIEALKKTRSDSVRRCLLSLLTIAKLSEDDSGYLFDYCFRIIESPSAAIAQKAYSMTILYNISEMEPDLKPELIALFESQLDDEHGGVIARSRILLKKLYRDMSLPDSDSIY
jgi:hypothetical protein